MPKSEFQKLKTLYIADMLLHESDEAHKVTVQMMVDRLTTHGIKAERKSVYNDIDALMLYGMDILMERGRNGGYWLASRDFELPELKLLVDAVQSSKFLPVKKSRELIKKLEGLTDRWAAQDLQRQVYVANRVKSMNESVYYSIDKLHSAINNDKQITFKYFKWNADKKMEFRNDGARYCVSPYALMRDDENYYLVAYSEAAGDIRHFRVDKMNSIEIDTAQRTGRKYFDGLDMALYAKQMFGMFGGEASSLEIMFDNELANVVIDRFGKDIIISKVDDAHFKIHIKAVLSPMLMGWLASFGAQAKLLAPAAAVDMFKQHCESICAMYK